MRDKEASWQSAPSGNRWPTRERVLEVACNLFAETGFHGTHLREVCKRANANVAGVCYHFGNKEGLYEAVIEEASRQITSFRNELSQMPDEAPQGTRLRAQVTSIFERLGGEGAWIAKLLARDLLDSIPGCVRPAGSGLRGDFVLVHTLIKELLGPDTDQETLRVHALSIVSECLLFCVLAGNQRLAPGLIFPLPAPAKLAQHVADRALGALQYERAKQSAAFTPQNGPASESSEPTANSDVLQPKGCAPQREDLH
ncbi:MAG TPA: CerR family C-terminal domain-containing protein [Candidatus Acidoferrum sp.]|nr:CerR family C-terminal domain-containing protein [Candidatus Acidoferrum sp.]